MYTAPPRKIRQQNGQATARPTFTVIALHDGFIASIRAQEALKWLDHTLGAELEVRSFDWSFHNLERLDLRAMSLRLAAAADLIIIAAADTTPLPDHIQRWLDACLQQQRDGRAVLVALHEEEQNCDRAPGPLCSQLEDQASRWHTEFICNEELDQRVDCDFALQSIHRKERSRMLRSLPLALASVPSVRRYGIND